MRYKVGDILYNKTLKEFIEITNIPFIGYYNYTILYKKGGPFLNYVKAGESQTLLEESSRRVTKKEAKLIKLKKIK